MVFLKKKRERKKKKASKETEVIPIMFDIPIIANENTYIFLIPLAHKFAFLSSLQIRNLPSSQFLPRQGKSCFSAKSPAYPLHCLKDAPPFRFLN